MCTGFKKRLRFITMLLCLRKDSVRNIVLDICIFTGKAISAFFTFWENENSRTVKQKPNYHASRDGFQFYLLIAVVLCIPYKISHTYKFLYRTEHTLHNTIDISTSDDIMLFWALSLLDKKTQLRKQQSHSPAETWQRLQIYRQFQSVLLPRRFLKRLAVEYFIFSSWTTWVICLQLLKCGSIKSSVVLSLWYEKQAEIRNHLGQDSKGYKVYFPRCCKSQADIRPYFVLAFIQVNYKQRLTRKHLRGNAQNRKMWNSS